MLQKRDMVLATAILLMTMTASGISHYTRHVPAVITQMSLDGAVVKTLDLSKNTKITITSPGGSTNRLIVKNGEI